jgi:hypothetical protein
VSAGRTAPLSAWERVAFTLYLVISLLGTGFVLRLAIDAWSRAA